MNFDMTAMDETEALALTAQLMTQLDAAREEAESWRRRAAGIRKMIDGLVGIFPAAGDILPVDLDGADEPRPRGAESVLRVLTDHRGQGYTVPGVVTLLQNRSWMPESSNPLNAVRTALERLVASQAIQKSRSIEGAVVYTAPSTGMDLSESAPA